MKGASLIISFVLGGSAISTVAYADPPRRDPYNDRDYDRDRWRDDYRNDNRYDRRYDRGDARPLLTMGITPRQRVTISPNAGRFSRLRVEAVRGQPYIDFVYLVFRGGETQRLDIGRSLVQGESIDLDLLGRRRAITSITVGGQPDRYSRVTIVGIR
ncbi:MAG: hypothetical protein AB7O24_06970 [Kofleriaceae bacterium]